MNKIKLNSATRVIFALWFMVLVNYLDRVAMSFAGPAIMKSLSLTPGQFGMVLSSFGIGYSLAQIPGGLLADRWGAKALLILGPVCWAIFTGATGLVSTFAGFVIVRVCFGISEGISNTSLYKAIADNFEAQQRARAIGICSTALALAPAFAGAFVGKLVSTYGWQMMFFLMMLPSLLVALSNYRLIPSRPVAPAAPRASATGAANDIASIRNVLRRRSLWLLSLAAFAWNIAYWGYLGWMPSYLSLAHHLDLKAIGPLAGVPYVFAFLGLLLGGWLGTALHRHCPQLVMGCFMAAGLSLFLAYQADTLALALTGLSSAAFFLFGTQGPIGKIALDLAPEQYRATYVGIYNTAGQAGGVVAPAIIGFLVSSTGSFAGGFGFMIAALCIASTCMLALVPLVGTRPLPAAA